MLNAQCLMLNSSLFAFAHQLRSLNSSFKKILHKKILHSSFFIKKDSSFLILNSKDSPFFI